MIIYKITNKINNKSYIGQTTRSLKDRIKQHLKRKDCLAIKNAIDKYGIESFDITIIDKAENIEELNKKESEYIAQFKTLYPEGYNLNTGGFNKKWSEESKKKMSKSHTGKKLSQEHKNNISKSVINVFKNNPEKKLKGRKQAIKSLLVYYSKNQHPKKGKKLSEESKKRISQAKLGFKNPQFGKKANNNQLEALKKGTEKAKLNAKPILCHQNNQIYKSTREAAKALGIARSSIRNVLIGFRKTCKGYTFEYITKEII